MNNDRMPRKDPYSNYYVLPLLGLSRASFGPISNYCSCKLDAENNIVVEVLDRTLVAYQCLGGNMGHVNYLHDYVHPEYGTAIITYYLPVFRDDLQKFREGRYSRLSEEAKWKILNTPTIYNTITGKMEKLGPNHVLRHVLERTDQLRKKREEEFSMIIPREWELLDLPGSECFTD